MPCGGLNLSLEVEVSIPLYLLCFWFYLNNLSNLMWVLSASVDQILGNAILISKVPSFNGDSILSEFYGGLNSLVLLIYVALYISVC